jgi:hypothetical protein
MKLGYDNYYALVVHQGQLEAVFVRKNAGPGHSFLTTHQNMAVTVTEYDEQLDIHFNPAAPELSPVHVVALTRLRDQLPPESTYLVPNKEQILAVLPDLRSRIEAADMTIADKYHLVRLFSDTNAVTLACPFMGIGPDSIGALEEAMATAIEDRAINAEVDGAPAREPNPRRF